MRILFWVPYPKEGASNRYRIEQYLPYLEKEKIDYSLHPFWGRRAYSVLYKRGFFLSKVFYFLAGTLSRIADVLSISRYSLVFIHREAYPIGGAFFEKLVSVLGKPIIYDFDDAIFLPATSRYNNFIERLKKPGKVAEIIRMSRRVLVGNDYLAEFALKFNPSVEILPTSIDTLYFRPAQKMDAGYVTIGWIGSITTVDFLKEMSSVFDKLSSKFPNVRFKIVGGELRLPEVSAVISKQWSLSEELEDLRSFDIGIMPMPDNEWTRGKCGFKAILCMSVGVPCVCSAVGVNTRIINDGVNGFLARTEQQWVEKLSLLIENKQLRERMGIEARKTVEAGYSVALNSVKFLKTIKQYNGRDKR